MARCQQFPSVSGDPTGRPTSLAPLEADDASAQPFVWPVRHHSPRGMHRENVVGDLEKSGLFCAHPLWVPGHIHLGDPPVVFQSIRPCVCNQAVQKPCFVLIGFCRLPSICSQGEGQSPCSSKDHITTGLFTHWMQSLTCGLHLNGIADELPGPINRLGANC